MVYTKGISDSSSQYPRAHAMVSIDLLTSRTSSSPRLGRLRELTSFLLGVRHKSVSTKMKNPTVRKRVLVGRALRRG